MVCLLFKKFAVFKVTFLCAILGSDVSLSVTEASRSGCSDALGMENGNIKISQLSSYTYYPSWDVNKGRLHRNSKSWCSDTNDATKEYFQIDLLRVRHVSAIATQGVKYVLQNYYVKTFMIKYSYDGALWFFYEAENGADVIFTGNSNGDGVKKNNFRDTFVTRYLRIYPKSYSSDMCLRVEVYGCSDQADDCSRYITSLTGSITSTGYPVSYPSNKDCTWLISVSGGKKIALMFTRFDVKHRSGQQSCKDDFVEVRNGLTDISRQIGGKYCNGNKPMLITTPRNIVRIHFHSGSTAGVSHRGFKIDYLTVTPGSDDVLTAKSCDADVITLDCSSTDYTINILHTTYGSFPYSCGQQSTSTTCSALDVKSKIVSKCQDYKECRFSVSGSLFGYSCPNGPARNQLEVFYQCTSRNIKTPAPTTSAPTPSKQGSTVAPSTVSPITTNSQPSHSFTDETTSSPTKIPLTEPSITKPTTLPSQVVFSVGTEIPPPRKSGAPPVGGKEAQTGRGMSTGIMAGVIVVAVVVILVVTLIAVFFVRRKRQRKSKEKHEALEQTVKFTPEREYSMPANCPRKRCPLDASSSAYDTVNILYESADNHSDSSTVEKEDHNAYASCLLPGCEPKITENPLYKGVSRPLKNSDEEGYELVKSPNVAPHNYDSPTDNTLPKVKSINNPNYEKTLELTNHEYAVPDCQLKPGC